MFITRSSCWGQTWPIAMRIASAPSAESSPRFCSLVRPCVTPAFVGAAEIALHSCAADNSTTAIGVAGFAWATLALSIIALAAIAVAHVNAFLIIVSHLVVLSNPHGVGN